jgi:hypothetical protein
MSDADSLNVEQAATLWALDFDLCVNNVYGTTDECMVVARYEQVCVHCNYVRPLCHAHAAATQTLATSPDEDGPMPVWRCERCLRCSADFRAVFHLYLTRAGACHG